MRTPTAMLVAATVALACGSSRTWTEYQNRNNGLGANLTFSLLTTRSVGETAVVEVARAEDGLFECASHGGGWNGERVECRFLGSLSPVAQLLETRCDGAACAVEIAGTSVRLTGLESGTVTLWVKAKLADGTVLEDSSTVDFAKVDAIGVSCAEAYRCPGPHAVFVGASFLLLASPSSNSLGTLPGTVAVASVEPVGVVAADFVDDPSWGRVLTVRALGAGEATIRLTAGSVEKALTVHVAQESDAVSAAVHRPALTPTMMAGPIGADADVVGEAAPASLDVFPASFIPVWTLRDGTTALGAASRVKTARSDVEINLPGNRGELVTEYFVGGVDCVTGDVRVTAQVGSAKLDFTYDQKCKVF